MMKIITTLLVTISLLTTGIVYSHTGATGIVKERMEAMKDMGDKAKTVADMLKGKTPLTHKALADAADAFISHGTRILELFPDSMESQHGSKTEALPRIWKDWDDFSEQAQKFLTISNNFKSAVSSTENTGELKKVFNQTAKACKQCHKRFRKPKN